MAGGLVKTLADYRMPKGDHQIEWNKRDEAGNAVSPGIYILQFDAGAGQDCHLHILLFLALVLV